MAVITEIVEHTLAGGGLQSIPLTKFSPTETPKGFISLMTGQTTFGFTDGHSSQHIGFGYSGTAIWDNRTTGYTALDNSSNNDCDYQWRLFNAHNQLSSGLNVVTDVITNLGFSGHTEININQSGTSTTKMIFFVIGGSDVTDAQASSFRSLPGIGVQQFTDMAWQPSALIYASAVRGTEQGTSTGVHNFFGVADQNDAYCCEIRGFPGGNGRWRTEYDTRFAKSRNRDNGNILLVGNWNGFLSNGWEVDWTLNASGQQLYIYFLALRLTSQDLFKAALATAPTTPGNVSIPVGHDSKGAIVLTSSIEAPEGQVNIHGQNGIGFSDMSGKDYASSTYAEDNQSTSRVKYALKNDKSVHLIDLTGNLEADATLSASGNNILANFTTANGDQAVFITGSFGEPGGPAAVDLAANITIAGWTAGDGAVIRDLRSDVTIAGHVAGDGTVTRNVASDVTIQGHVAGDAIVGKVLAADITIAGHVAGDSLVTRNIAGDITIQGHTAGDAIVDRDLASDITILGHVAGDGLSRKNIQADLQIQGHVAGDGVKTTQTVVLVGPGQTYLNFDAMIIDYNAGSILTSGELLVAVTGDILEPATTAWQGNFASNIIIRPDVPMTKRRVTKTTVAPPMRTAASFNVKLQIEDLLFDGNNLAATGANIGSFIHEGSGTNLDVRRCEFFNSISVADGTWGSPIVFANATTGAESHFRSCLIHSCSMNSTTGEIGAIISYGGDRTINVDGVIIDNITALQSGVNAGGLYTATGTATWNVRNSAITGINANGPATASMVGVTFNQTTNATYDGLGAITGIDERVYRNARRQDYRLYPESPLVDAGTKLTAGPSSVSFSGFNRDADTTRDPWDIGHEETFLRTYTVGASQTYSTPQAFQADWNAGLIGLAGENAVCELREDFLAMTGPLLLTNQVASGLVVRPDAAKFKARLGRASGNALRVHFNNASVDTWLNDLNLDGNQLESHDVSAGVVHIEGANSGNIYVMRSRVHGMHTVGNRLALISATANATYDVVVTSSMIYDGRSQRDSSFNVHAGVLVLNGDVTFLADGVVWDDLSVTNPSEQAPIHAAGRVTGNLTVEARNCATTRITGNGAATSFAGNQGNTLTTCATFDGQGTITGINENEFRYADFRDYVLNDLTQLQDVGTALPGFSAVDYDGWDRIANTSRGAFDIGAHEKAVISEYTIGVGQTYATIPLFIADLNSLAIGANAESVRGRVIGNITGPASNPLINTTAYEVIIFGQTLFNTPTVDGGAPKYTVNANGSLFWANSSVPMYVLDLEVDYDGRHSGSSARGCATVGSGAFIHFERVFIRNSTRAGRAAGIYLVDGTSKMRAFSSVIAGITATSGGAYGIVSVGTSQYEVYGCVIHGITHDGGSGNAQGIGSVTGTPDLADVRNTAVTDVSIIGGGTGTATCLPAFASQTTNLSSDATAVGQTNQAGTDTFVDITPASYDWTPKGGSAAINNATALGNVPAAFDLTFYNRNQSADPWDIGVSELLGQDLKSDVTIIGHTAGDALVARDLKADINVSGHIAGDGIATRIIRSDIGITGHVAGDGIVVRNAASDINILGHVAGNGQISGQEDVASDITIQGHVAGDSQQTHRVVSDITIAGHVAGDSGLVTPVASDINIVGHVAGDGLVIRTVASDVTIQGHVAGDSQVTANIAADVNIMGHVAGEPVIISGMTSTITILGHVAGNGFRVGFVAPTTRRIFWVPVETRIFEYAGEQRIFDADD